MTETIAIIDYGSGNLRSVQKAFERVIHDESLTARAIVTNDADAIAQADRIVLPGVGAFKACMDGLSAQSGIVAALQHAVLAAQKPFFGICVGMQLLADKGLEFGETPGLGWISGEVEALTARDGHAAAGVRVPHIGWNNVAFDSNHPVFSGPDQDFYFVHSFYFRPKNDAFVAGLCSYGGAFAAAVARDNIIATQFHPEKSQRAGLALIKRFLAWRP